MTKFVYLTLALGLAGCNPAVLPDMTTTGSVFGGHKAAAYEHTIAEKRPVQEAFVKLPRGSGEVVDLTERRHGNGVEQLIVYAGDFETRGENAARVKMKINKTAFRKPKGGLKISPPNDAALAREMSKAMPGVRMNISNEFHTNAYGPFGYAIGRASGNVNCIYGWQHMRGNGRKISELPIFNKASDKPELSLRLRVCKQNASKKQLVDLMRNLRVTADPARALSPTRVSWNSGPGGNTSLALPTYEHGGYVSDEIVAVEPAPQTKPVAVERVVKKKKVRSLAKPRKTVVTANPVTPKQNFAAVPLPTTTGNAVAAKVVPVPAQVKTSTAPSLPVVSYGPPVEKKTVGGFAAVPLPN